MRRMTGLENHGGASYTQPGNFAVDKARIDLRRELARDTDNSQDQGIFIELYLKAHTIGKRQILT